MYLKNERYYCEHFTADFDGTKISYYYLPFASSKTIALED